MTKVTPISQETHRVFSTAEDLLTPDIGGTVEELDLDGSTLNALHDSTSADSSFGITEGENGLVTYEIDPDVDSERLEDAKPSDKDMIELLSQSLADVNIANRQNTIIAEIALKGAVLPSPAGMSYHSSQASHSSSDSTGSH